MWTSLSTSDDASAITLDATYGQLRFDQLTGWSRWLRLNRQEPNLECYDEYREIYK